MRAPKSTGAVTPVYMAYFVTYLSSPTTLATNCATLCVSSRGAERGSLTSTKNVFTLLSGSILNSTPNGLSGPFIPLGLINCHAIISVEPTTAIKTAIYKSLLKKSLLTNGMNVNLYSFSRNGFFFFLCSSS